jgi:hypothetical protein
MNEYQLKLTAINEALNEFNNYLSPRFQLKAIKPEAMVKVVHGNWNAFPFPNNGTAGVYFIFGRKKSALEEKGLYIGKASFGKKTSDRLYYHLVPHKGKEYFVFSGRDSEEYIIDYIASINLEENEIPFMAPALEEFLITDLSSKLMLMNAIGNGRR